MLFEGTKDPFKTKNPALAGFICLGVDSILIWFHSQDALAITQDWIQAFLGIGLGWFFQDIGCWFYVDFGWNLSCFRFVGDAPSALTM